MKRKTKDKLIISHVNLTFFFLLIGPIAFYTHSLYLTNFILFF
jgi:hypothetical protein